MLTAQRFRFELGIGWTVMESEKSMVTAVGKRGQTARVTAASIGGAGPSEERQEIRESLRHAARRAMQRAVDAPGYVRTREASVDLPNGLQLDELEAQSPETRIIQGALTGPAGLLLLTLEGEAGDARLPSDYQELLASVSYLA
jgi:hypothetical protein